MVSIRAKNNWTNWHHKFHKQFIHDKKFIPKSANLLVAVSGGQDSMAMMTLINDIKNQHDWKINIWHGDHQWHKDSSHFAKALEYHCCKNGIPFYSDIANKELIASEEKARNWRYEKLCNRVDKLLIEESELSNWYILTGHTSTDNTETFLLNLTRGSSYKGLAGIQKKRLLNNTYKLIRPLLIFSREDTSSLCENMEIPCWEDPTNLDLSIKRNLIRHKVLPHLDEIYPGYTQRINQFVSKMNNFSNEQEDLCQLALEACKNKNGIKRQILNNLGLEARSTILHTFIKEKCIKQISSQNLENISIDISTRNNGQINLPNGLKIIWNKDTIRLET
tara:strand:+ start:3054 stop:4058 length:1005 start_codon:yes stop_codon:yes gene_type:complete